MRPISAHVRRFLNSEIVWTIDYATIYLGGRWFPLLPTNITLRVEWADFE